MTEIEKQSVSFSQRLEVGLQYAAVITSFLIGSALVGVSLFHRFHPVRHLVPENPLMTSGELSFLFVGIACAGTSFFVLRYPKRVGLWFLLCAAITILYADPLYLYSSKGLIPFSRDYFLKIRAPFFLLFSVVGLVFLTLESSKRSDGLALGARRWPLRVTVLFITGVGILALPAFIKYGHRHGPMEHRINVRKIYDGQISYFFEKGPDGKPHHQFVNAGPEPSKPQPLKIMGNWNTKGWRALKFGSDSAVRYSYQAIASGSGRQASFTARAVGDLDGDGITSRFERVGWVCKDRKEIEVCGGAGLYTENDLE